MSSVPSIPDELKKAFTNNQCAVFIGAGLSVGAGYPTWDKLLLNLIKQGNRKGIIDLKKKNELVGMVKTPSKWLMVAQELSDTYGKEPFNIELANIFDAISPTPTTIHKLITEIPFEFVVTTNYDQLIENAYVLKFGQIPKIYTHVNVPDFADALWKREFFILKAHGDLRSRSTIILTERDYRTIVYSAPGYRALLAAIFTTKTILFLGVSLGDPELQLLLRSLHDAFQGAGVYHYALVPSSFSATEASHWRKNYNVHCIVYEPSTGHPEVGKFLRKLRDSTKPKP